jgi:polyhydroxyalkanoate synthesis regulator phasin
MPVAKLSREFYERFGDKLTDELVNCLNAIEGSYRAELRDLFEAHFGRFEEKLERRLSEAAAELGAELRGEINRLDLKVEQLRTDVHRETGAVRSELIKWTIGFWVPVALGVIGLYFKG